VRLWREVIKNALIDAGISLTDGKLSYVSENLSKSATLDRHQALHFLTDDFGGWKTSRKMVCYHAMICPERLRENTLKILAKFNSSNGE
jgi:hypothetical protein